MAEQAYTGLPEPFAADKEMSHIKNWFAVVFKEGPLPRTRKVIREVRVEFRLSDVPETLVEIVVIVECAESNDRRLGRRTIAWKYEVHFDYDDDTRTLTPWPGQRRHLKAVTKAIGWERVLPTIDEACRRFEAAMTS